MKYGTEIKYGEIMDDSYVRFVGYKNNNIDLNYYYSKENVGIISKEITNLLKGVDPDNRPIIVPDRTILNILDSVYMSYRPKTGDIYGRYNVPSGDNIGYIEEMIDQTIEIITSDVKNNLETEENNRKLTIWTTVLGDFNEQGLRSHPTIKIRERRPTPMLFNMNY